MDLNSKPSKSLKQTKTPVRKKAEPKIPDFLVNFVKLVENNKADKHEYLCYRQPSLLDRSTEVALPYTILDMERASNALINNTNELKKVLFSTNPDDDTLIRYLNDPEIIYSLTNVVTSTLRLIETISPGIDIFALADIEKLMKEAE